MYNYQCDLCNADHAGKHLKNDHDLNNISDLTSNFSVLKKCSGKLDCLIYEMLFIRKKKPSLNTQSDSIRAKLIVLKNKYVNETSHF